MQAMVLVQSNASPIVLWSMILWICTELHCTESLYISFSTHTLAPQIMSISSIFSPENIYYALRRLILQTLPFEQSMCECMADQTLRRLTGNLLRPPTSVNRWSLNTLHSLYLFIYLAQSTLLNLVSSGDIMPDYSNNQFYSKINVSDCAT